MHSGCSPSSVSTSVTGKHHEKGLGGFPVELWRVGSSPGALQPSPGLWYRCVIFSYHQSSAFHPPQVVLAVLCAGIIFWLLFSFSNILKQCENTAWEWLWCFTEENLSWITMPDPFSPPLSLRNEFIFSLQLLMAFCVYCGSDSVAEFRRGIMMITENQKDGGRMV